MAAGSAASEVGAGGQRAHKTLGWKDVLAVAMVMPAGAIASYGYWTNSLGTWGVLTLIGISTLIAVLQDVRLRRARVYVPREARRHRV